MRRHEHLSRVLGDRGRPFTPVGDEPQHERGGQVTIRAHQPGGRLLGQRGRHAPAPNLHVQRESLAVEQPRDAFDQRSLPRIGEIGARHLTVVEERDSSRLPRPLISTMPSKVHEIRYGKSADGSLDRSSGGNGSGGVVWLANMQASCSSSASQKVISPYSGSVGHHVDRRADRDRLERLPVVMRRVHQLAAPQVEHDQLLRQPDRHVSRDPRRAVALRVGQEIPEMDVGQPSAWKQHAQTRVVQAGDRGGHGGKKEAGATSIAPAQCALRRRPVQTRTRLVAGPQRQATCCFSFASIVWRGTAPTI